MKSRTILLGLLPAVLLSLTVGCATEKPHRVPGPEPQEFSADGLTLRLERFGLPVGDPSYVEFALQLEGDRCRRDRKVMVYPEGSSLAGDGVVSLGDQMNTGGSVVCDCCLFLGQRPPHTLIAEHYDARIEVRFEEIDWPEGKWHLVDRDSEPRVRVPGLTGSAAAIFFYLVPCTDVPAISAMY